MFLGPTSSSLGGFTIAKASLGVLAVAAALFSSAVSSAQPLIESPAEKRPQLPPFEPPPRERGTILPPVPLPTKPSVEGLVSGLRVFVRHIRITGSTVLTEEALQRIAAPYEGRQVTYAELEALRDRITSTYIKRGYVTSGAVIPDQAVENGVVEIQVIEGVLKEVEVETDGRLRASYVSSRLRRAAPHAVNVVELEEALQILKQDPKIDHIQAQLVPGEVRGESLLRVRVAEARPYFAELQFDNHQAPSVGNERGFVHLGYLDITGYGDSLSTTVRVAEGLQAVDASYEVPLNSRDTTVEAHLREAWSNVVEAPFDALDISSEYETYGFTLTQPAYRSVASRFDVFLTGEWRRSKDFLLGSGFQFSEGISEKGVSKVAVVRFGHDWFYGGREQAFAVRNTFSVGLDILGATANSGDVPDGQFFAWLGQAQWARRLPVRGVNAQVIARTDVQLASSALLGLERFALGGHATVRGYRENEVVRDNAVVGSVEIRVPILARGDGSFLLELAPFFDIGHSWNTDQPSVAPHTLASPGIGARARLTRHVHLEAYWGYDLRDIDHEGEWNLQDSGFQFALAVTLP